MKGFDKIIKTKMLLIIHRGELLKYIQYKIIVLLIKKRCKENELKRETSFKFSNHWSR